jgi:hypothetical protein
LNKEFERNILLVRTNFATPAERGRQGGEVERGERY